MSKRRKGVDNIIFFHISNILEMIAACKDRAPRCTKVWPNLTIGEPKNTSNNSQDNQQMIRPNLVFERDVVFWRHSSVDDAAYRRQATVSRATP